MKKIVWDMGRKIKKCPSAGCQTAEYLHLITHKWGSYAVCAGCGRTSLLKKSPAAALKSWKREAEKRRCGGRYERDV